MTIKEAITKSTQTGQIVRVEYGGTQTELLEEIGAGADYSDDFVGGRPVLDVCPLPDLNGRINVEISM